MPPLICRISVMIGRQPDSRRWKYPRLRHPPRELRCVEVVAAIIAAGYEFPAYGVSGSLPKPALSSHELARILVERHREQPPIHHVIDCLIGECPSIVFAEPNIPVSRFYFCGINFPMRNRLSWVTYCQRGAKEKLTICHPPDNVTSSIS